MPKKRRPQYRLYLGKDADGKRQYKSFTADTRKQAKKDAQAWSVLHTSEPSEATLKTASERFLALRSETLSPSTLADYTHRVDYLSIRFPDLFKTRISAITTDRIQEMVNALAGKTNDNNPQKKLSPKTVYAYYGLIETILRTNGIEIRNVQLPKRQPPQLNIPEDEQVRALIESVKGTHLEIPVLLAALGPMRRGEICALTMDDIDFTNNIVHVRRSMVTDGSGGWKLKMPKSAAGTRDIKYPGEVFKKIQEQGYITHCNPDTITGNFTRHLQRHNLPRFRFHDLRHYAASFLLALNIPPTYVMERGGWQSNQTMRRYVHALEAQKEQFSAQANDAFKALL